MVRRILEVVAVMVLAVSVASAGVLRVEQDGSGEYLLIQDAVDAAADGDTILIGPGRYDDLQPRGYNNVVCVARWDDGRDLTFIGESADQVVLGPEVYQPSGSGPQGLHQHTTSDLSVSGITFTHLQYGIVTGGGILNVEAVTIDTGRTGVVADVDSCSIRESRFTDLLDAVGIHSAVYAEVTNCELNNAQVYFGSTQIGNIRDTVVNHGRFATYYDSGGSIERCSVTSSANGGCMSISGGSVVSIYDSSITGGETNATITSPGTHVTAERCTFSFPSLYSNFELGTQATLVVHNCDIRAGNQSEYILRTDSYPDGTTATIDVGGNYWFEHSTPAALDSLIYDGNDDPNIHVIVNYEPIRTSSVPTEKKSLGSLKALFLGR